MTEPVYSAKQEQGGTAVGASGPMPAIPVVSNAPASEGTVGPPAQSDFPSPGRGAAFYGAIDSAAATYASLAEAARQSPGTVATSAVTAGASNGEGGTG